MSQQPSFLTTGLEKILARIDRETVRLARMKENTKLSDGVRQEIEDKIHELRKTRLEITQLMSRLERL